MSKSNNIVKWGDGNNIVDSGISITSIGSGSVKADMGFLTISDGSYVETISHTMNKNPIKIEFITYHTAKNQNSPYTIHYSDVWGYYMGGSNRSQGFYGTDLEGDPRNIQSTDYSLTSYIASGQRIYGYVSEVSSSNFKITFNNTLSSYPLTQNVAANTFWNAIG